MKKIIIRIGRGALTGICAVTLVLFLWLPGFLDGFEWSTWDLRARLLAEPGKASGDIALILLDQQTLDWGDAEYALPWPWPRQIVGILAGFCERAGTKALAYDVIYSENSKYGVEDDELFRDVLDQYGKTVGAVYLNNNTGYSAWPVEYTEMLFPVKFEDSWLSDNRNKDISFSHASFPIPELISGFASLGNVNQNPDSDGIFRDARLFSLLNDTFVPGLALGTYLTALKDDVKITISDKALIINNRSYPLNKKKNMIVRFHGPSGTYKTFSAKDIIESELALSEGKKPAVQPLELKDNYVLFGYSAPGLKDLRPSPVDAGAAGVEIHAAILDNLITGDFIRDIPRPVIILFMIIFAMGIGIGASFFTDAIRSIIMYGFALLLPLGAGALAYMLGFRVPVVAPVISLLLTLIGVSIFNFATEGRQKRFIKNAFKQYLSPAVIEQLIADPDKLALGGERKEISIYFSDLQGFTSISEALTPEGLTSLLNDFLSAMTDIILDEGGTVDKYEGDAIIAFWNAPLPQEDHALRAVRAALSCQTKLAEMRPAFRERVGKDLFMRIGMNTGIAVVGNMGSRNRFDYTMLGDAVNLASRLEGINKQFNSYFMISQATKDRIGNAYPVRELSRVTVVGRKEPVTVYEPMPERKYDEMKEVLSVFSSGLQAYYEGDFRNAKKIFETIVTQDPVAGAYLKKCDELLLNPPKEWSGVWVMTTK
ncbi:MAG: adenylate/guanylate cyclase domain-containing protein [Spirochaetales bacterium]|nr:adenylate/guanylate cyclase domain-containing protein [Spirochaetales bacterium]